MIPHLVYFADPMCSWCWGFAPVIDAIAARHPDLPVRLVLGGLRPFTETPMDEQAKAKTQEHWRHVEAASGQPFDYGFFDREGFVYDTEPAARAVVAARRLDAGHAFPLNRRIAEAFYAGNRDVTDPDVLIALAADEGLEAEAFAEVLHDDATREETLADFAVTQASGVTGFPTLVAGPAGKDDAGYLAIAVGFRPAAAVLDSVGQFLRRSGS
ncbi:DsbA family protein [Jiella avicenniae]|uniref:DsbA family protein n=1 Tax=Jiella avicenniae TaxID=2907202 RepID=A0A9X1T5V3_9HYPH|nr:DsbA family protein [Jiella avicenniae]MCE7029936.1 DsbA family protein [Jiella avicenniae]